MEILLSILGILMFPLGIAAFVCWILVIVKAFKKEESPLMGILCIVLCNLGALIIGWINAKKWDCKKLMMIYTFILVIFGVVYGATVGLAVALTPSPETTPGGY